MYHHTTGQQPEYMFDGRLYPPVLMHAHPGGGGMPGMPGMAGMGRHEGPAGPVKICGVCGDRAKSLHFGGMACDSCKAFFRRSVQNEAYKHFRCAYERPCVITMSSRKSCQACRFNKCEEIGMERTWVMTEEERSQQSKIRQEKKRQKQEEEERRRQAQEHRLKPHVAQLNERHLYLSDDDVAEIEHLENTFYQKYREYPVPGSAARSRSSTRVVDVFINCISRIAGYAADLPRFRSLCTGDQKLLLKNGVLSMAILRGAMTYNTTESSFALKAAPEDRGAPTVAVNEIKTFLTPDLYEKHQKFLKHIMDMRLDERTLMLLQMVVLYSSDRMGLTDATTVGNIQEHYTNLLRRYMNWWYGEDNTRILYPRMLHRLADLRTLAEAHNMNTIRFSDPDIGKVVERFRKIDINPYPACPDFLQGPRVLQPSDVTNRDPDRGQSRSGRSGAAHPPPDRQVHRSNSMPGFSSGFARYGTSNNGGASGRSPQAAVGTPYPAHAQYGATAYPSHYFASGGSQTQACDYTRDTAAQWNPAYQEEASLHLMWAEDQRMTPLDFTAAAAAGGGPECDFNSLLGLESRGDKRLKSEPNSPMISPAQSQQLLMAPVQGQPHHQLTSQHNYVTSQNPAPETMTSSQYNQSQFSVYEAQGFDQARGGYSSSSGGYHTNYPPHPPQQ